MRTAITLFAIMLLPSLVFAQGPQSRYPRSYRVAKNNRNRAPRTYSPRTPTPRPAPRAPTRTTAPIPTAAQNQRKMELSAREAKQAEAQALSRVGAFRQLFRTAEAQLQSRMQLAQRTRQQGLTKNDQRLLDQAEKIEKQAIASYTQRIAQLEKAQLSQIRVNRPQQNRSRKPQTKPAPQRRGWGLFSW